MLLLDWQLDADDAEWSKFWVWRDLDQDGESDAGELQTMAEAGIASVSLTSDCVKRVAAGNKVFGEGGCMNAGGIALNRHGHLPAARFLQRRHLISQAGEVDLEAAGRRVFAADCDFGRGCVDDLAFHGVEGEILRGHADAQAGRDVAGLAG